MNPSDPSAPVILNPSGQTAVPGHKDSLSQTSSFQGWPEPYPVEPCVPTWAVGACGCRTWKFQTGCHRLGCTACAESLRARRAHSIRDRFEGPDGLKGKPLLYTIFTVPPECRAAAADPETWRKWRRAIWRVLRKKYGGLFAVERTDPAGDRRPGRWHPHLNLLWAQVDGARPYLDTASLNAEWAAIVGSDRVVNIKHQFATNGQPKRREHWYLYMGRTWPDWQAAVKKHLTIRWLGKYPKKPLPSECCGKCNIAAVFISDLDEKGADELVLLGPAGVRACWDQLRAERKKRRHDRIGPPAFRGVGV